MPSGMGSFKSDILSNITLHRSGAVADGTRRVRASPDANPRRTSGRPHGKWQSQSTCGFHGRTSSDGYSQEQQFGVFGQNGTSEGSIYFAASPMFRSFRM
jgi:hypothetical protein